MVYGDSDGKRQRKNKANFRSPLLKRAGKTRMPEQHVKVWISELSGPEPVDNQRGNIVVATGLVGGFY